MMHRDDTASSVLYRSPLGRYRCVNHGLHCCHWAVGYSEHLGQDCCALRHCNAILDVSPGVCHCSHTEEQFHQVQLKTIVMCCHGSLVLDDIGQLACIHVHQFHQELHCVIYDAQPCDADVWQELWPLGWWDLYALTGNVQYFMPQR